MIIHEIHDLSNKYVIELLLKGLSKITDEQYVTNYHPDYASNTGNLFYILEQGRYVKGKYYVLEEDNGIKYSHNIKGTTNLNTIFIKLIIII